MLQVFVGGYGKWNVLCNYEKNKQLNDKLVQYSMSYNWISYGTYLVSYPSTCIKMHFSKMSFGLIITMGAEPTTLYNPGNDNSINPFTRCNSND